MQNPSRDARLGVVALVLAAGLAFAGVGIADAGPRVANGGAPQLLPDIVMQPIVELRVIKNRGVKLLRFSSIIGNRGSGVVELLPRRDDCDGNGDFSDDRSAVQQVYLDTNGTGAYEPDVDRKGPATPAGCSFFHPEHNHWHFEEFARYTLSRPTSGRVVASAEKVSFCVRDSIRFASGLPGSPSIPAYGECSSDSISGLSVGWADYYGYYLPGQELDIRGLPGHRFCLRLVSDPTNRLEESNDDNNERSTLIRIRKQKVTDLGRSCPSV